MMNYIPLTFGFEALFPPFALPAAQLRTMYVHLADPCRFTEFRLLGESQGARFAEGKNRHLTITSDRFIYRDEFTQHMYSTFCEDTCLILKTVKEIFQIPVLLHSKVLIRLLMPFQGEGSTAEYFQNKVVKNAVSQMGCFDRPTSGIGMKLVFPPSQDRHSTFNLRIEPYYRDIKMFFLENSAQFFDPIVDFNSEPVSLNQTYSFVKEQAGPFILSFASSP